MSARGQVSALGGLILLGFVVFFFALYGAVTQWSDTIRVENLVRQAALVGAQERDRTKLAAGVVALDVTAAQDAARSNLARNMALSFPPGPRALLDAITAAQAARIRIYNATRNAPIVDPDPAGHGQLFHYATLCVTEDIPIRTVDALNIAVTHHVHACAQSV